MSAVLKNQDFLDSRTTLQQAVSFGTILVPVLTILAVISIIGWLALPVLIPLWIYCHRSNKAGKKVAEEAARSLLASADFTPVYEYKDNNVVISLDGEKRILAFWLQIASFTPAIYGFDEIKEVTWEKDGDVITSTVHTTGPISIPHTSTKKGKTTFTITTNRLSQPNISFVIKSPQEAKDLTQRLSIAMGWVD